MPDEIREDKVIDLSKLSVEDQEKAWEEWVRAEVNAALDIYLPISKTGHVNLSYSPTILEKTEGGDVLSGDLKDAVMISLIFEFKDPINMSKPRVEDDEVKSESGAE